MKLAESGVFCQGLRCRRFINASLKLSRKQGSVRLDDREWNSVVDIVLGKVPWYCGEPTGIIRTICLIRVRKHWMLPVTVAVVGGCDKRVCGWPRQISQPDTQLFHVSHHGTSRQEK